MNVRVRGYSVWTVAALAIVSIGLSAVPVVRRVMGGSGDIPLLPDVQAVAEPLPPDLAPIIGFAPFGSPATLPESPHVAGETSLGLVLLGITVADPVTASRAIIGGGDVAVASYAIGAEIASTVRLAEVHSGFVILDVDGQLETLPFAARAVPTATQLEEGPDLQNLIPRGDEALDATDPPSVDAADEPDPDAVLADYMERLEDDPQAVVESLGLVPTDDGYRIADTAASAVQEAGFQPGDLLTRVNGQKVGDLFADQVYFREVAASGRARVEIQRDGQTIVLTFPLR